MDCNAIRNMLDEETRDPSIREHLAACPSCRAEAEFGRRVSAALASMPRVPAPRKLAGSVMAELRPSPARDRPAGPRPSLRLRPWELSWLGAATLLLIAALRVASETWTAPLTAQLFAWLSGWGTLWTGVLSTLSAVRAWTRNGAGAIGSLGSLTSYATAIPIAWACGAVAFALGLFLLLSWHGSSARRDAWEDAHA